jgi:hypothetical protein
VTPPQVERPRTFRRSGCLTRIITKTSVHSLGRCVVDHWDWHTLLRARKSDPIQKWAEMESKSATMSDELYQAQLPAASPRRNVLALFVVTAKLVAAIVQTWLTRSR